MMPLFAKAVGGQADEAEQEHFALLWQARVARMLLEHADDPNLIHVVELEEAA